MVLYLPGELTMKKTTVRWQEYATVEKSDNDVFHLMVADREHMKLSKLEFIRLFDCMLKVYNDWEF